MISDKLERIRERAYALWERAGRQHGEHEAHWHQASAEIDAEDGSEPRRQTSKSNILSDAEKSIIKPIVPPATPKKRTGANSVGTSGRKSADTAPKSGIGESAFTSMPSDAPANPAAAMSKTADPSTSEKPKGRQSKKR